MRKLIMQKRFEQASSNYNYHNNQITKKMKINPDDPEIVVHMIKAEYWSNITGKNSTNEFLPEKDMTDKELWENAVNDYKDIYIKKKFFTDKRRK